ncbi:unnamed protein product [Ixodes persulcatus]
MCSGLCLCCTQPWRRYSSTPSRALACGEKSIICRVRSQETSQGCRKLRVHQNVKLEVVIPFHSLRI